MYYRPAELDDAKLEAIQSLEAELGKTVVAIEPPYKPAAMTPAELDRLRKAEESLGVVLVAYEN